MQTWTLVRFLHIAAVAFFVGGQLLLVAAVAPVMRRRGDDEPAMKQIARRFGLGSLVALAVLIATGAAMASHFGLWDSNILQLKLLLLVVVFVLTGLHIASSKTTFVSWALVAASLLIVWFGVKLTYG